MTKREGMSVPVYYSFFFCQTLLSVGPPAWVMAKLRPSALQRWVQNRLFPVDAVVSLKMTNRATSDFHEVPESQELALSLIMTGRRWEKLIYLSRLLLPPTSWLRYFYVEADVRLWRRRLAHAPKLFTQLTAGLVRFLFNGIERRPL
jgi:hypothetical protein